MKRPVAPSVVVRDGSAIGVAADDGEQGLLGWKASNLPRGVLFIDYVDQLTLEGCRLPHCDVQLVNYALCQTPRGMYQ